MDGQCLCMIEATRTVGLSNGRTEGRSLVLHCITSPVLLLGRFLLVKALAISFI